MASSDSSSRAPMVKILQWVTDAYPSLEEEDIILGLGEDRGVSFIMNGSKYYQKNVMKPQLPSLAHTFITLRRSFVSLSVIMEHNRA